MIIKKVLQYYAIALALATLVPIPFSIYNHANISVYDKDGNPRDDVMEISVGIDDCYYLRDFAESDSIIKQALENALRNSDTNYSLLMRFIDEYSKLNDNTKLISTLWHYIGLSPYEENDEVVYYSLKEMTDNNNEIFLQRLEKAKQQRKFRYQINSKRWSPHGTTIALICDKVKNPESVVRILTTPGRFEIWQLHDNDVAENTLQQVTAAYPYLPSLLKIDGTENDGRIGNARAQDTAAISEILETSANEQIIDSRVIKFFWSNNPVGTSLEEPTYALYPIRITTRDASSLLDGSTILDVANKRSTVQVQLNNEGGREWKRITGENIGKYIAIVIDDHVYSTILLKGEDSKGVIKFDASTLEKAEDLAIILRTGEVHISELRII